MNTISTLILQAFISEYAYRARSGHDEDDGSYHVEEYDKDNDNDIYTSDGTSPLHHLRIIKSGPGIVHLPR